MMQRAERQLPTQNGQWLEPVKLYAHFGGVAPFQFEASHTCAMSNPTEKPGRIQSCQPSHPATGKAYQERTQGGQPRPLRDLPDGQGRGAEEDQHQPKDMRE